MEVMLSRIPRHIALVKWPRERLVGEMLVTWPRERGLCLSPRRVGLTLRSLVSWFRAQRISLSYKQESLSSTPGKDEENQIDDSDERHLVALINLLLWHHQNYCNWSNCWNVVNKIEKKTTWPPHNDLRNIRRWLSPDSYLLTRRGVD